MTRVLATSAAVAAVLVGAAGVGTTAVAVAATDWRPVAETGTPGRLVLHTGPEPLVLPGAGNDADVTWQVRTSVDAPGPVTLDLQLTGRGGLPGGTDGVLVSVATCDQPWGGPVRSPHVQRTDRCPRRRRPPRRLGDHRAVRPRARPGRRRLGVPARPVVPR